MTKLAYGDGRIWDLSQANRAYDIIDQLQGDVTRNDLEHLRKDSLWLLDALFPTGFSYIVNRGPSEPVHGGYMEGQS